MIRAIAYRHGDRWIGQCLEFDLAAQADTRDKILDELARVVEPHVEASRENGVEPFVNLPRAPNLYFQMFDSVRSQHKHILSATGGSKDKTELELAYA